LRGEEKQGVSGGDPKVNGVDEEAEKGREDSIYIMYIIVA